MIPPVKVKQSRPAAQPPVASPVGSQGREQMRSDVLVLPQATPGMQEEPAPQSVSLVQNCRQVLIGCATVEQVVNSKHPEPGTQSLVSAQESPGFALPAEKQS